MVVGRKSSQSVNWKEVSKFSKIAKEWWNPHSKAGTGPLHALNPIRVEYIRQHVVNTSSTTIMPFQGLNILDVGCGGGLLSESLARLGGKLTSIDPSQENIGIAQWHSTQDPETRDHIEYQCTSIEQLVESLSEPYDVVCCLEVLEHVQDVEGFVSHLVDTVKPGGQLFLSTLNKTIASYLLGIVAAEKVFGLVPNGTHDWDKFIPPKDLEWMLTQRNMTIQDISGIVGDPYVIPWQLSRDRVDVNYILCARKNNTTSS